MAMFGTGKDIISDINSRIGSNREQSIRTDCLLPLFGANPWISKGEKFGPRESQKVDSEDGGLCKWALGQGLNQFLYRIYSDDCPYMNIL